MMDDGASDHATVEGIVNRIIFEGGDGWSVIRLRTELGPRITAVGPLLGVRQGDRLRLTGSWTRHPRFGEQLEVSSWMQVIPETRRGLEAFLGSGRIRGLGPTMAARVVDAFGLDTLEILDHQPDRLREVRGIGARTVAKIRASWSEHRGVQQLMVFLSGHGIAPSIAARAYRRYGARALDVIRENPFRLADEVRGVGFATADRVARGLGIAADAPVRLEAGIRHALDRAALEGHTFVARDRLLESSARLLECDDQAALASALASLALRRAVVERGDPGGARVEVLLDHLDRAEGSIAERLGGLIASQATPLVANPAAAIARFESRAGIELAAEQRAALQTALSRPVVVVTGGPGTGKTTLVRGLVEILASDHEIELTAPTGRAAKRLAEATGLGARTIHRLLEYNPAENAFARHRQAPIEADVLVVDETSMLDVPLAASLLDAVPAGCHVVFVGDDDQLPSVGPGRVLGDLIESGAVPVVRLDRIFRQAERSLIVGNAHRINRGLMPVAPEGDGLADFYFVRRNDPVEAARLAVEFAARRIPNRFGLDPFDDIQVLSPMHRGELGVANLNQALQTELNPAGEDAGFRHLRVGDKVMQIRNNYQHDVFNGDLGRIIDVDREEQLVRIDIDGRVVEAEGDDLDDLIPAYACTIHKAQGSEYPAVVLVLHHQHHVMLQRNLLYTGVTRGRRLVVVVGSERAMRRAIATVGGRERHTTLASRLKPLRPEGR